MNQTFEQTFERAFLPLQEIFGHQISEDALRIYLKHLKSKLTPEQLMRACVHLLDNFKPTSACKFPTPAHFVEYATGTAETKATNAVSRVMAASRAVGPNTSVTFGDKALHRTIERFGGWEEMRDFDWKFRETNFKKVYMAEIEAGDNFGPDYLEGCYEKNNRLTQHTWTHGEARPLLIAHVGEHGQEVARLPPPDVEIPREAAKLAPAKAVSDMLDGLSRKLAGEA
jgi:hypothetical protein